MKQLLFAALVLAAAACGSESANQPSTTISPPRSTSSTTTSTLPGAAQRDLMEAAQQHWSSNRPSSYEITYALACECDGGPWLVRVADGVTILATRVGISPGREAPYQSVDAIFDEIEATLDGGRFPVNVEYDTEFGYPNSYIFNEPELPVDGGFILTVTAFEADPSPGDPEQRQALVHALAQWEATGPFDYDYTFTRGCFCPEEFIGPYQVSVRGGVVAAASFRGTDLFDIDMLEIGRYEELTKTVEGVFAEIERAFREADSFTAEYHPVLGYPTNVYIDWVFNAADEEVGYTIESLRDPAVYPETCSTEGWDAELLPQPDLPDAVAATRFAIFEAAMRCDFGGLVAISDAGDRPVETSHGGSGPERFWQLESQAVAIMRDLVEHLNLPFEASEDGSGGVSYVWPSAIHLTSPYGEGIPAADYEALLEVYRVEDLEEMFEPIGGYVGRRLAISPDGQWLSFLGGD